MSEQHIWSIPDLERLQLEGLDHLVRLQSGAVTRRDEAEFVAWHGQSKAHEEAFRSAVILQQIARLANGALDKNAQSPEAGNVVSIDCARGQRVGRRAFVGGALAASIAGIVVVGRSLDVVPSIANLRADYRTKAGEHRLVHLAGGATVNLNTRTSVNLLQDHGAPTVELLEGEAIMTSGRGPDGRATLVAGKGTSSTEAGRFNARRDGDDVCITCLNGQVSVAWQGQERHLSATEEVRYNDDRLGEPQPDVNVAALTAWQSGTLIFHDMPMRQVIAEINRYRPGAIVLGNSRLAETPLTGTYRINRLDDFFIQVRLGFDVQVTRLPGNVAILT